MAHSYVPFGKQAVNPDSVTHSEWDDSGVVPVIRVNLTSCCGATLYADHEDAKDAAHAFGLGDDFDAWSEKVKGDAKARLVAQARADAKAEAEEGIVRANAEEVRKAEAKAIAEAEKAADKAAAEAEKEHKAEHKAAHAHAHK